MVSRRTIHILTISSYLLVAMAVMMFSLAAPAGLLAGLIAVSAIVSALAARYVRKALPAALGKSVARAIMNYGSLSPVQKKWAGVLLRERLERRGIRRESGEFLSELTRGLLNHAV